jgi:hypothetical protein
MVTFTLGLTGWPVSFSTLNVPHPFRSTARKCCEWELPDVSSSCPQPSDVDGQYCRSHQPRCWAGSEMRRLVCWWFVELAVVQHGRYAIVLATDKEVFCGANKGVVDVAITSLTLEIPYPINPAVKGAIADG